VGVVLVAALVAMLLLAVLVTLSSRSRSPARLGYRRQPDGTWTRVAGPVHVTWRKPGRFTVRTGYYAATDFVAEPRDGGDDGPYAFPCGVESLDARFRFWSERPPFAKALLGAPAVGEAMCAFPPKTRISLRGDELVVESPAGSWADHERVVVLAREIARSARPG
jgi:hypothetical protein